MNIHDLIELQNQRNRKKCVFLVMRTLRIYYLNNNHKEHTAVSIIFIMLYFISLVLITVSLYLLNSLICIFYAPTLPASGNRLFVLCDSVSVLFNKIKLIHLFYFLDMTFKKWHQGFVFLPLIYLIKHDTL